MSLMSFQPGTLSLTRFCFFFLHFWSFVLLFVYSYTLYALLHQGFSLVSLFFFGSYVIRTQKQALLHTTRFLNKSK